MTISGEVSVLDLSPGHFRECQCEQIDAEMQECCGNRWGGKSVFVLILGRPYEYLEVKMLQRGQLVACRILGDQLLEAVGLTQRVSRREQDREFLSVKLPRFDQLDEVVCLIGMGVAGLLEC